MLKKIRQAGENLGVLTPATPDAQAAAEQRRQQLVAAQAAVASAEAELERRYDAGASPPEIAEAEAALADAKLTAERAQRAYSAAEKRLAAALAAEDEKAKAEAARIRDAALGICESAAAEIDRLAAKIAEKVRAIDAQAGPLAEAARAGVAARTMLVNGQAIARHALEKAGALPSNWIGDKAEQPGAAEIAAKHAGAVLAGAS